MKKQTILLLGITLSSALFTFCKKDDDTTPTDVSNTVSVSYSAPTSAEIIADVGEVVSLAINVTAEHNLTFGILTISYNEQALHTDTTYFSGTTNSVELTDEISVQNVGAISVSFKAYDENNNSGSATLTISGQTDFVEYKNVMLGNIDNLTTGSYYNAIDNIVYKQSAATTGSATIDFVHMHYLAGAELVSPKNINAQNGAGTNVFTTKNSTQFEFLSFVEYDNFKSTYDLPALNPESGNRAIGIKVDDILIFKLDDTRRSKRGVLKVTNITGEPSESGTITFDVKIES